MAASEAAVTAVMETLGCSEFESAQDGEHYCRKHRHLWLNMGCQDAAIAARAAVDADRASIQAEALREFAERHRRERLSTQEPIWPSQLDLVADWIEGKP